MCNSARSCLAKLRLQQEDFVHKHLWIMALLHSVPGEAIHAVISLQHGVVLVQDTQ